MTLRISGLKNPEKFVTPHHVHTKTGDGKELIILTGVVIIDLKGESGEQWRWETVDFGIPFRHIHPVGKALAPENWAVFVTINAIYNAGSSYNSGHAVDAFELLGARAGLAHRHLPCRHRRRHLPRARPQRASRRARGLDGSAGRESRAPPTAGSECDPTRLATPGDRGSGLA